MDTLGNASLGARRNEDIALDLMKFVAGTAGIGRPAGPSAGFSGAATAKPEEHVSQLRVAVAGAGSFGRNHLRVYRELETAGEGVALVAVVEPDAARAQEVA